MKSDSRTVDPVSEATRILLDDDGLSLVGKDSAGLQCPVPDELLDILEGSILRFHGWPPDALHLLEEISNLGLSRRSEVPNDYPSPFLSSAVAILTQEIDKLLVTAATSTVPERQRAALSFVRAALKLQEWRHRAPLPASAEWKPRRPLRLNIGAGTRECRGWVRADLDPSAEVVFDAGGKWPVGDGAASAIYMSHVLEHLEMPRACAALMQARRVLAQGETLRIVVPNAASWLQAYASNDTAFFDIVYKEWSIARDASPLEIVMSYLGGGNISTRLFGHRTCFDFGTLKAKLGGAGFNDVRQMSFMDCSEAFLRTPEKHIGIARRTGTPDAFSLFVEAR